jgi:hypothetical protein
LYADNSRDSAAYASAVAARSSLVWRLAYWYAGTVGIALLRCATTVAMGTCQSNKPLL